MPVSPRAYTSDSGDRGLLGAWGSALVVPLSHHRDLEIGYVDSGQEDDAERMGVCNVSVFGRRMGQ